MRRYSAVEPVPIRGFTLVEVTLALGILAFCLVAILGLMPVGLDSFRNASRQAEAATLLRQIGVSLLTPVPEENGVYRLADPGTIGDLSWAVGGSVISVSGYMTSGGVASDNVSSADFVWSLQLMPPEEKWKRGQALVRIAWPATATWTGTEWANAQGSMRTLIFFRP